jgi:hypothetical protein
MISFYNGTKKEWIAEIAKAVANNVVISVSWRMELKVGADYVAR